MKRPISPKLLLVAFFVACMCQTSWAFAHTGGNIWGVVRDAQTGEPLAGVSLQITSQFQSEIATTDTRGHFIALTLQPGVYTVIAEKSGYGARAVARYVVDADETGICDFRLERR
jgi:hypothetical protein